MTNELQNLSTLIGISMRDVRIIVDVVEHFSDEGLYSLKHHLITLFRQDIRPEHYIILGVIIGLCCATDKEHNEFINQNSYQSCLRQN